LSSKAASTIYSRVQAAAGGERVAPEKLLRLRLTTLRKAGLSAQKTSYLRDLARKTCDGELDFEALPALSDDEVIEKLTQVKGIGVWTAHMFLIFALKRPDVLPVGDLGIQTAIHRAWELPERPKPKQVEEIGARWRPWCSVASWYLWTSLGGAAGV
jgi:DNA-3-methyladenine glycosylase II